MVAPPILGKRAFTPNDRFFKLAEYLTIYMDMEIYALVASQRISASDIFPNGSNPIPQGDIVPTPGQYRAAIQCRQFNLDIKHFVFGPFWAAFQPNTIVAYEFEFVQPNRDSPKILESDKWGAIAEMFWNTALVFFYEQNRQWIQQTFGSSSKDLNNWPPIFRFAWALRNAASHHGGRLNITDEKVLPVTWHHLSYDHRNVGLRVFGDVMTLGDMLLFLVQFSDELDRLGAPTS